jgi:integrase
MASEGHLLQIKRISVLKLCRASLSLRRTHATLLSQAGASPWDAQAQLGHPDIGTTMNIYTQPTPDHQRAAVERAGQLVTHGDEFAMSARLIRQLTTLIQ